MLLSEHRHTSGRKFTSRHVWFIRKLQSQCVTSAMGARPFLFGQLTTVMARRKKRNTEERVWAYRIILTSVVTLCSFEMPVRHVMPCKMYCTGIFWKWTDNVGKQSPGSFAQHSPWRIAEDRGMQMRSGGLCFLWASLLVKMSQCSICHMLYGALVCKCFSEQQLCVYCSKCCYSKRICEICLLPRTLSCL